MYEIKIKELENQYRILGDKIFNLEKIGNADKQQLDQLNHNKNEILNEIRRLRKLQWDHDHEYVNFDDRDR